ncbi:hypothetical protein FOL47_007966 [Perkinsus chesapeaki]|uniref:Uncharacterized protein n=1 Tax=Perkinsus chesapeaki TaxID=330153 RepID=A0A7J6LHK1_PERCH|nr:hypothetical protein FOL47_007966 [Perkinsus chesapeaki]
MTICGVLPPLSPQAPEQAGPAAIILDWDDTILPSTFIADKDSESAHLQESLERLQDTVVEVLSRALLLTENYVFILTSSSPGWVHESCQRYLPRVVPLLCKVTILHSKEELSMISRKFRRLYYSENKSLVSSKLATVLSVVPTLRPTPKRVVLIGDQYEDVAIAQALRQGGMEARTCLFAVAPTPNELCRELQWLLKNNTLNRLLVDDELPQSDFTLKRNRPAKSSESMKKSAVTRPTVSSCASSTLTLVDVLGVDPKVGPMVLGLTASFVPAGTLRQCGRCRTPIILKAR